MSSKIFSLALFITHLLAVNNASAIESRLTYQTASGDGAAIEIGVLHSRPFNLVYGILLPRSRRPAESVRFKLEIYDPAGLRLLPLGGVTCDVGYIWFGGCETVPISTAGETRIIVKFPAESLKLLHQRQVQQILILIQNPPNDDPITYWVSVDELRRRAVKK